jgi:hypothetical protein
MNISSGTYSGQKNSVVCETVASLLARRCLSGMVFKCVRSNIIIIDKLGVETPGILKRG